jgi:hypothetical protein
LNEGAVFDTNLSLENDAFLTADILEHRNKLDGVWERICKEAALEVEAIFQAEF